jgi:PadR family transcriptional regulator PadR
MARDQGAKSKAAGERTPGGRTAEANPWVSQMRKGLLEFLVLAVLKRGEAYGYVILKELREFEGLSLTESTVYLLLARLTRDGLLRARKARSPEGPPRRYYSLTAAGRRRLVNMTAYWKAITKSVDRVLAAGEGR